MEVFGPDACVDSHGAGKDGKASRFFSAKAFPFDKDVPSCDVEALQMVFSVIDGFPCGEEGFACIDESASVYGDAVRVGNDDVCPVSRHFQKSVHGCGTRAGDFVYDDFGRSFCHVIVPLYVSCQFGFGEGVGVVQDGAFVRHVEGFVFVPGYAAGGGGGDIDKGYAVCCFFYLRLMAGFRFRIGHDGARRHAGGACHKQSRCQPYGYIPSESFACACFHLS